LASRHASTGKPPCINWQAAMHLMASRHTSPEVTVLREIFDILLAIIVIWLIWKFIQRYLML